MTKPTVRVVSSPCLIGALLAAGQPLRRPAKPAPAAPQGAQRASQGTAGKPEPATQKPPVQGAQTTEQPTPPKGEAGAKATGPFTLSVDSIMQGPKLVGYPPSGLRWSGDSQRL